MDRRPLYIIVAIILIADVVIVGAILWRYHALTDAWETSQIELRRMIDAGSPLVEALEKHNAERGRYPDGLADLAPSFVKALPPKPDGARDEWQYSAESGGRAFELRLSLSGDFYPHGYSSGCLLVYRSDRVYSEEGDRGAPVWADNGWALFNE